MNLLQYFLEIPLDQPITSVILGLKTELEKLSAVLSPSDAVKNIRDVCNTGATEKHIAPTNWGDVVNQGVRYDYALNGYAQLKSGYIEPSPHTAKEGNSPADTRREKAQRCWTHPEPDRIFDRYLTTHPHPMNPFYQRMALGKGIT